MADHQRPPKPDWPLIPDQFQLPKGDTEALPVLGKVNIDLVNHRSIRKRNELLHGRLLNMVSAGKTAKDMLRNQLTDRSDLGLLEREAVAGAVHMLEEALDEAIKGENL